MRSSITWTYVHVRILSSLKKTTVPVKKMYNYLYTFLQVLFGSHEFGLQRFHVCFLLLQQSPQLRLKTVVLLYLELSLLVRGRKGREGKRGRKEGEREREREGGREGGSRERGGERGKREGERTNIYMYEMIDIECIWECVRGGSNHIKVLTLHTVPCNKYRHIHIIHTLYMYTMCITTQDSVQLKLISKIMWLKCTIFNCDFNIYNKTRHRMSYMYMYSTCTVRISRI